jgi:hypothetical protein
MLCRIALRHIDLHVLAEHASNIAGHHSAVKRFLQIVSQAFSEYLGLTHLPCRGTE